MSLTGVLLTGKSHYSDVFSLNVGGDGVSFFIRIFTFQGHRLHHRVPDAGDDIAFPSRLLILADNSGLGSFSFIGKNEKTNS